MAITLITGPANAGKAQLVFELLRGALARAQEPLLVLPTRADAAHYLRELTAEGPVMGLRVVLFDGLIEEVVSRAGVGGRALGAFAQQQLLARLALGAGLADGQTHPPGSGLLRALADFVGELEVRRVSPQRLERALAQWAAADPGARDTRALAALYRAYREALQRIGRLDSGQRALRALDALRATPSLWRGTPVLLYGFDSITDLQLDVIETLGRVVDASVTVSLSYERGRIAFAGRARAFAALEPIAASHRELASRADYYEVRSRAALAHLERSLFDPDGSSSEPGAALVLLEGGGERAELELVAREIRALLDGGMAPEEIALAARSPELLADLLEEVLAEHAVPFALQRRRRLGASAVGRALLGLLRCVAAPGAPASTGELADLLAWLRAPGLLERPQFADALELECRRSGVRSADAARGMWEQRHWPLERIDRMRESQERGSRALLGSAGGELARLFAAPRRRQAALLAGTQVDDARALAACRRALDELAGLLEQAPELVPGDAAALADVLERVEYVSGEPPGPGVVAVLDPLALRARRVRVLFLCGLQEGVFPARAQQRALLDEDDRRRIAESSGLVLAQPEDPLAAERYLLYAAVSRPEQRLVLSWHTADDDGAPTPRSLFLDDVRDLFDASLYERRRRRALGEIDPPEGEPLPRAGARADAERLQLREQGVLELLRARPWSASSLETWMRCPVRWFVERMLSPTELDPDEDQLVRGGLAHAALAQTFEQLRALTGSARMEPAKLALARRLLREALAENEGERPLSLSPERLPGIRRRLRAELERYLEHAAAADSPLEPLELELGFGFEEEGGLAAFELDEGVLMRGRIDRVDVSATGDAVVYDYKSSARLPSARWIQDGSVQVALYMLAVEALLKRPVAGGFYQPLSGDLRARGVLDAGSAIELDCVRTDLLEGPEMRELLEQALELARGAVAEARAGRLRALPDSCGFRGSGCSFPTICRCRR